MRVIAVALVSALALAACGQRGPAGGEQSADAGAPGMFPNLMAATYRAEASVRDGHGGVIPVVTYRDGRKQRMEFTTGEGSSVIITNGDTGESFVMTNAGGHMMAMRLSAANTGGLKNPAEAWADAAAATHTGPCSGAGQSGQEWTRTEGDGTSSVCVTGDGIILTATENGSTVWETTSVQRGPQSADLFVLPPGVQVMDMSNMAGMAEALARARARDEE